MGQSTHAHRKSEYLAGGIRVERYEPATGDRKPGVAPVICVHGGCHASWSWQDVAPVLAAAGLDVHALNWRGRNGSDALPEADLQRMSLADVCDDIAAVAATLPAAPVIVAHSMGGLVAQLYAAKHDVAALVLLTPVVTREAEADIIELPLSLDALWGPPPFDVARELFFQGLDEAQSRHYHDLLVPESPLRVHEATRWTLSVAPADIRVPVMIVSGAIDRLTPASTGLSLARLYGADHYLEPDLGHNVLLGAGSRRVAERVVSWLDALHGDGR